MTGKALPSVNMLKDKENTINRSLARRGAAGSSRINHRLLAFRKVSGFGSACGSPPDWPGAGQGGDRDTTSKDNERL